MKNEIRKLLLVLGLFSLSGGMFYNFQELWMIENNLSIKTIGIVLSLCALISVSVIFLSSNLISQNRIKRFTEKMLLFKAIVIFSLFILHGTGLNILIKFLIMLDYALDVEIVTSMYPMITMVSKDNKLYTIKEIIYDALYYSGVFFSSFMLGKTFFNYSIGYNFYLLISSSIIILSYFTLKKTDLSQYLEEKKTKKNNNDLLFQLIRRVKKDKISKVYLCYVFSNNIVYYLLNGLLITLLTTKIGFSPTYAANFTLILGVGAVILGTIVLSKLTFRNDYLNIGIKYGGRLVTYILAATFSSNVFLLIAIIFTKITSDCYLHVTESPYLNRYAGPYQLSFCNLKGMVGYFGRSVGTLIAGFLIVINPRYVFLAAAFVLCFQLLLGFKGVQLRKYEESKK